MSALSALREAIYNPKDIFSRRGRHYIGRVINKAYHSRGGIRKYNPKGIDIFNQDWDNLIILDACRYDSFSNAKERHGLPGELKSRISQGSQTPEWLWANFHNKELFDTVYITASSQPYVLGLTERKNNSTHEKWSFNLRVHDLINLWDRDELSEDAMSTIRDRKKDFLIPPDLLVSEVLSISSYYPNKRLLIHIREPHTPYTGTEMGDKIHSKSEYPWWDKIRGNSKVDNISVEDLREAYKQNVDRGVDAAGKLIKQLDGKTVVSADHGEMLWERSFPIPIIEILHPNRTYTDQLVRVPWLINQGERRKIIEEPPKAYGLGDHAEGKKQTADDQLEALGYLK